MNKQVGRWREIIKQLTRQLVQAKKTWGTGKRPMHAQQQRCHALGAPLLSTTPEQSAATICVAIQVHGQAEVDGLAGRPAER